MDNSNPIGNINEVIYCIRTFFVLTFTLYIFMKFIKINNLKKKSINRFINIVFISIASILSFIIGKQFNSLLCMIFQLASVIVLNLINYKKKIGYTMINTIISFGVSYLLLYISVIISSVPNAIFNIQNDYLNLMIILIIYTFVVWRMFKIKKIENGLIFLQDKLENENLDLLLLNLSMMILYAIMILFGAKLITHTIVISIIFIITIKKSLDSYYKQTLLIQDLKDTKAKLEEKTQEIEKLEKENLEIGKKSHSLAHKQKILENKINEVLNIETGKELTLKDEIEKLSKEVYGNKKQAELTKTDISLVDDVLRCMQKECIEKNIDFELQVNGNIHYMINHYISEEELQILIADHVKDAIIAIEHSENINRSILVKLGEFDGTFSLYIYDSGIEFEKEVLDNLGKKPITTHKDSGGTGMGFMNTFDTLKNHNASLIIKEIGPVSETEYTKAIMIKFDDKEEFRVESYK